MNISEDFLLTVATLAISLIGFSGVVTALGHRGEGKWTSSEKLQLQSLVEPSLIALFGSFTPIVFGLITENHDVLWRLSNGFLLILHLIGFGIFIKRGIIAGIHIGQKIISMVTIPILIFQVLSVIGLTIYHELAFSFSLLLAICVSVVNFYLLLFFSSEENV